MRYLARGIVTTTAAARVFALCFDLEVIVAGVGDLESFAPAAGIAATDEGAGGWEPVWESSLATTDENMCSHDLLTVAKLGF